MYDIPSAYRSGMLVKLYREAGGRYSSDKDKGQAYRDGIGKNGQATKEQQITHTRIPYIARLLELQKIHLQHLQN